jgi:hypothetical protein
VINALLCADADAVVKVSGNSTALPAQRSVTATDTVTWTTGWTPSTW